MNFFLEEIKIDLHDTPIENIFLNDYMPFADGTYVKVYLAGYKFAKDDEKNENFNNETISKHLRIPLSDVLNAWNYWENQQIIKKHFSGDEYNYKVEFISLKQLYVEKIYKNIKPGDKIDTKAENTYVNNNSLIEKSKIEEYNNMHSEIEKIFGKFLNINDKRKINTWLDQYNINTEMMIQAFSYSINNKNKRSMKFIEGTIATWDRAGVTDLDSLSEFLEKKEERYSLYSRISQSLGFSNRALTEGETKTIDRWVDEFNFSKEMILKALENSKNISNPNINYFDAILEKWHKKGYKTIDDLSKEKRDKSNIQNTNDGSQSQTKKQSTNKTSKNKFHNYQQNMEDYSPEQLEDIAKKNLEDKMKKFGLLINSEDDKK